MGKTPSYFIAVCPNCLISLRVKYAWSGRNVRCKHCDHKFQALSPDFPPTPSLDESAAAVLNVNSISSEVDRMSVVCPNCSTYLRVRFIYSGQYVRCGQCEKKFLIPSVAQAPRQANLGSSDANVLNQLCGKLEHPHADQQPRGAAPSVSEIELETVRGVLGRILAEFGTLREDRVRIRMERNTIRARFKRLRGKYELLKSERDNDRSEHQRLGAEHATIREALGALTADDIGILKADHESLRRERDRIVAELGTLREDRNAIQSERDSIQAQLEQLRGELDQLGSEQDQERQEHQRQGAELATIREALGPFTPGEISSLKAERESLKTETDRLREQVQTLRGELSARGNPAEFLAQGDDEIHSARVLGDQLKEQIRHLEAALEGSQADRDQLNQEVREQHDQLEAARAQWDRLSERIHERDEALKSSHAKLEEIAQQLRGRDDELSAKQAELERLAEQRQAALNDAEQLRTTFAQREQEVRLESHQRHAEIDDLHRTRDEAVQNHRHERNQLAEQLRRTREQLDSEESQRTALQARIGELQDALQKLKIDHRNVLESERPRLTAEIHSTTGAKRSLHAEALMEALAEIQVSAQENSRPADRLNAEIPTLAQSLITPDADLSLAQSQFAPAADLEAARQESEVLRKKVAELEKSKRSISSMLAGMGIKVP